jgi:hypothetical protein
MVRTKMELIKVSVSQGIKQEILRPLLLNRNQMATLFSLSLNLLKISVDIQLEEFQMVMKDKAQVLK